MNLRLVRADYVRRDHLNKLRSGRLGFQRITCYLAEKIGIKRPCAGNSGPDVSLDGRPTAFKVIGSLHIDFFCDRLQTGLILNGQTDGILGMFKPFAASCDAKSAQDNLHGCHWYILPNPETQEDDRSNDRENGFYRRSSAFFDIFLLVEASAAKTYLRRRAWGGNAKTYVLYMRLKNLSSIFSSDG